MIKFRVISAKGDEVLTYECAVDAQTQFDALIKQGMLAAQVVPNVGAKQMLTSWEELLALEEAEPDVDVLFMYPIAGG